MGITTHGLNGMVVAPHHAAANAGAEILRRNGNAVEAAVATAAALCAVYPHMTGLGGDAFFLISPKSARERGLPPLCVEGAGPSGRKVRRELYLAEGLQAVPTRGPLAAATVAGAVGAWETALQAAAGLPGGPPLPSAEILATASGLAEEGFPVTPSQSEMTAAHLPALAALPGFAETFLKEGRPYLPGERLRLPALAETLRRLGREGLSAFYRGGEGREPLARPWVAGSPLCPEDLADFRAALVQPVGKRVFGAMLYNTPPPTQGAASLMILGLLERCAGRLGLGPADLADPTVLVHLTCEAVKQVFAVRNFHFADPVQMERSVEDFLTDAFLANLAGGIRPDTVAPAPEITPGGDTVWFGAADRHGTVVSAIQSIYYEYGSGVVLPESGIAWQNRVLGFDFAPGRPNSLGPGKKPFHTLNPALAVMPDGRCIAYGSMGGDGQPQTQAAIFVRAFVAGLPLQRAINAPRWLFGRAWGDHSASLKLEDSFPAEVFQHLRVLGHETTGVAAPSSLMGHAGAVVLHSGGLLEGAADERGDGCAAAW